MFLLCSKPQTASSLTAEETSQSDFSSSGSLLVKMSRRGHSRGQSPFLASLLLLSMSSPG